MFYRSLVGLVPGTDAAVSQINAMGTASITWYIVPSVLLLIGLRYQHPAGLVALTIALLAVGVTMYNGAALATHLNTIFASVLVLAGVVSLLILPPNRPRVTRTSAALH